MNRSGLPYPDFNAPSWRLMKAILAAEIAELRFDNDSPTLGLAETAFIRGQIYALSSVMNLETSANSPRAMQDPFVNEL